MVGDGRHLAPAEAAPLIGPDGVSRTTVRDYFDEGLLRGRIKGKWHRQIEAESIDDLNEVLRMPGGTERDAALADLREGNLKRRREAAPPNE